jgi:uncharacterized repeat protein (TIGR01451 family)
MKAATTVNEAGRRLYSAILAISLLAGALGAARPAFAQNKTDVAVSLVAQKVATGKDGREVLRPADRAFPGEVVQYDALYRNTSARSVRNLAPTLPIPPGLEYVPDSAKPAPAQASVDGKAFAPFPLLRPVKQADGTVLQRPVPWSEYRALRWSMGDLDAGKSVTVSARARLGANLAAR